MASVISLQRRARAQEKRELPKAATAPALGKLEPRAEVLRASGPGRDRAGSSGKMRRA